MSEYSDVDGCYAIHSVIGPRDTVANIANVTTRHFLVKSPDQPVTFNLPLLGEIGRCSMGFTGPVTEGMPSLSGVYECYPYFGKTKVSIYEKGSVVQTGYNSGEQALLCAYKFARKFNDTFGTDVRVSNFSVINIVSIVQTERTIDLDTLKMILGPRCYYENPQVAKKLYGKKEYSGAIVISKLQKQDRTPKMVIFSTGVAVFMGCQSRMEIVKMMEELYEYLDQVDAKLSQLTVYKNPTRTSISVQQAIEAANDTLSCYKLG